MFNYLKWELKDEFKKKSIPAAIIAAVYLLVLLLPEKTSLYGYVMIPFIIIMVGSLFLAYLYGPYRNMHSYQSQTFLLESMIPLTSGKLLIAKYILAILFDIIFGLVFILGCIVLLATVGDLEFIKEVINALFQLKVDEVQLLLRLALLILSTTIVFTSFVTMVYLMIKSFFPNLKIVVIISYATGLFLFSAIVNEFLSKLSDLFSSVGSTDIILSVVSLLLTVVFYFVSVWFIENKLEVYN